MNKGILSILIAFFILQAECKFIRSLNEPDCDYVQNGIYEIERANDEVGGRADDIEMYFTGECDVAFEGDEVSVKYYIDERVLYTSLVKDENFENQDPKVQAAKQNWKNSHIIQKNKQGYTLWDDSGKVTMYLVLKTTFWSFDAIASIYSISLPSYE